MLYNGGRIRKNGNAGGEICTEIVVLQHFFWNMFVT